MYIFTQIYTVSIHIYTNLYQSC